MKQKSGRASTRGKQIPGRNITFDKWMGGGNAAMFATREEVVAFCNLQLRDQIMPLVGQTIAAYDAEIKRNRWYRRSWRWLKGLAYHKPHEIADLPTDARDELRAELDAADAAQTAASEEEARPRTCVTCGSGQLEPVNEAGGLQCEKGHVLEDPPAPALVVDGPEEQP